MAVGGGWGGAGWRGAGTSAVGAILQTREMEHGDKAIVHRVPGTSTDATLVERRLTLLNSLDNSLDSGHHGSK